MTKRRKKALTRQILLGMLAAGVLWGGFAAQAEASDPTNIYRYEATSNGDETACNNSYTEATNIGAPESAENEEYAVGYVGEGIAANANGNTLTLETGAKFYKSSAGRDYYFSIYGGKLYVTSSSNANNNTVIVNGGEYTIQDLVGGYGNTASYNTVTINDTTGTFTANAIMGGDGSVNDYNTVNINGGTFYEHIE
ncbi:MAG: hypothetical protein IIV92_02325, partial [Schwartzia sp.]|nr:hypothetical protein [Schwartzia sp. (in: firmicutes)]